MNFTDEECESLKTLLVLAKFEATQRIKREQHAVEKRWLTKLMDQANDFIAKLEAPIARR